MLRFLFFNFVKWWWQLDCQRFLAESCTAQSWKPDWNEGQTHRHVYRKAGSGWAVPTLREWHLLHSNQESRPVGYAQHKEGSLVSKVSAAEQSQAVNISGRKLQATLSGHSVNSHTQTRGFASSLTLTGKGFTNS